MGSHHSNRHTAATWEWQHFGSCNRRRVCVCIYSSSWTSCVDCNFSRHKAKAAKGSMRLSHLLPLKAFSRAATLVLKRRHRSRNSVKARSCTMFSLQFNKRETVVASLHHVTCYLSELPTLNRFYIDSTMLKLDLTQSESYSQTYHQLRGNIPMLGLTT